MPAAQPEGPGRPGDPRGDGSAEPAVRPFKVCTMCGKVWGSREEFLADRAVRVIGYMAHFEELEAGLFHFNHEWAGCQTTLVISASRFADLHAGPMFAERLTGTSACPGYCLRRDELRPCPAKCECAFVRAILDRVVRWEKSGVAA